MEAVLVKCIENSLNQLLLKNAIFLCERLCAEFPSEVNVHLLARCYLNNNQAYCAYHILKGTELPQSRYLFAMSCFQMDLLSEAEAALLPSGNSDAEVPNGAAGHYLLGLIYRYTDRKENSIKHLRKALSIDPLFWTAYEELCTLGAAEEATAVFSSAAVSYVQEHYSGDESKYLQTIYENQNSDGKTRHLKHQEHNVREVSRNCHETDFLAGSTDNPSSKLSLYSTTSAMVTQMSDIAPRPIRGILEPNSTFLGSKNLLNTAAQAPGRKFVAEGKSGKVWGRLFSDSGLRRSPRLAAMRANSNSVQLEGDGRGLSSSSTSSFSSSVDCKEQGQGRCADTCDDASSQHTTSSYVSSLGSNRFLEHEKAIMKLGGLTAHGTTVISGILDSICLLSLLGEGFRLLCMYRCRDALEAFQKLSQKQYNTGWVLSQVGRAYYELVDYMNAEYAYSLARQYCPYILEGMDIYSTILYHLQADMRLSHLAQELISIDRLASQSWCAIGNSYSLQKEHETALKCFSRAAHLNSRHAYAFTLTGHECVALEEYENGAKCYQRALIVDPRHYNAWYGLGMIYLCQEKLEFAQHHFQIALRINPGSSIILCYIGTTLHELKRNEEALEMMEKAIVADDRNPLPFYQKAKILVSLEKFDEALKVLEELKEYAPRESSIYAMIGKIYQKCKKYDEAILNFGLALDLNSNALDVAATKAAIENLLVHCGIEDSL